MGNTNELQQEFGPISSLDNNNTNAKTSLSVNTTVLKDPQQNYNNNSVSSPSSPFFRRTMLSNVRQSWIFNKPPSIPEAESVYVQPTAILEKNLATAKSRLSVIIQKGGNNQQQYERIVTNNTYVKTEQDRGINISSPTINEASEIENSIDNVLLLPQLSTIPLSSRPISNVSSSSTNQDSNEYDALSDSSQSLSSSFTSNSIIKNNLDSMSDTTSVLSNSPSILNDHHNKFNRQFYNNVPHSSSDTPISPHHRYSMPSSSREFVSQNSPRQYIIEPPRRASMPILSETPSSISSDIPITPITPVNLVDDDDDYDEDEQDELKELKSTTNVRASFSSDTSNESSVQRATLRSSILSSPANAQFAQRASRASMRMSLNTLMQKRFNIAFEILTTERHYVDCLQLVQRV